MPGFDGTGPLGQGPMTGQGRGFCLLKESKNKPSQVKGLAGIQGLPVNLNNNNIKVQEREVVNMPFGDGTGPAGMGPMTGRAAGFCAGYPVPGYMNPVVGRAGFYGVAIPPVGPYGAGLYSYGAGYGNPYVAWSNPWFRRGFSRGLGRGRGWGCGRGGRFRFRW